MIIKRTIKQDGFTIQLDLELTAMELRTAYDEHQRSCRLEDITNHLDAIGEDDLCGYTVEDVTSNPVLMGKILQNFFKYESCELAENDVMEECIRTVLSSCPKKKRKAE